MQCLPLSDTSSLRLRNQEMKAQRRRGDRVTLPLRGKAEMPNSGGLFISLGLQTPWDQHMLHPVPLWDWGTPFPYLHAAGLYSKVCMEMLTQEERGQAWGSAETLPPKMPKITAVGAQGSDTHRRKPLGIINWNLQEGWDKVSQPGCSGKITHIAIRPLRREN